MCHVCDSGAVWGMGYTKPKEVPKNGPVKPVFWLNSFFFFKSMQFSNTGQNKNREIEQDSTFMFYG
jgi:hypothetical protein